MDREEAGAIADSIINELKRLSYDQLTRRFLAEVEAREAAGPTGTAYQVEIQAMWDSGRGGPLLVIVGVDDGSLGGGLSPVNRSFIVAGDGTIVRE